MCAVFTRESFAIRACTRRLFSQSYQQINVQMHVFLDVEMFALHRQDLCQAPHSVSVFIRASQYCASLVVNLQV